jgi:hypothetical protein
VAEAVDRLLDFRQALARRAQRGEKTLPIGRLKLLLVHRPRVAVRCGRPAAAGYVDSTGGRPRIVASSDAPRPAPPPEAAARHAHS